MRKTISLLDIYGRLFSAFGPQFWWPARTPFEVMVGAILTQNTNWGNVEKAIANLKTEDVLTPRRINDITLLRLSRLIRPSGFYNQKARRLKAFSRFLIDRYGGSIAKLRREETAKLREELLALDGIGPETADSILLYALGKPAFVVDAYTRRIFSRHGFLSEKRGYEDWQKLFTDNLPRDVSLYNEYHALIVRLAKTFCRVKPVCGGCPLNEKSR
jgi:endonuclease-3 related protein